MKPSLSIIVPAYNEAGNIRGAIAAILAALNTQNIENYEILVFDDASADDTGAIVDDLASKNHNIRVVHNNPNRGFGYNVQKGIELAGSEYLVQIPGDNEITEKTINEIFSKIGTADMVVAYHANMETRPLMRRVISRAFTDLINFIFRMNLKYFNGPNIIKSNLAKKIKISNYGFAFMMEILVQLIKSGHSFVEVPMYIQPRAYGKPTAFKLKNIYRVGKSIVVTFWKVNFTNTLKSLKNGINMELPLKEVPFCLVCGSDERKVHWPARLENLKNLSADFFSPYLSQPGHFQVVKCLNCGFLYSSPICDVSNLFYDEVSMEELKRVFSWKVKTSKRELTVIEKKLGRKGKLLEIGSGLGAFLSAARDTGWNAIGVEPSKDSAEFAKNLGLSVLNSYFDAKEFVPSTFDAVILAGVLDHLLNPREIVIECFKLLKPGGVIWITVTNGESILAKILKDRFPAIQYQHLYYFSEKTIKLFFESIGFKSLHTGPNKITYPLSFFTKPVMHRFPFLARLVSLADKMTRGKIVITAPVGNLEALAQKPSGNLDSKI